MDEWMKIISMIIFFTKQVLIHFIFLIKLYEVCIITQTKKKNEDTLARI